MMMMKASFLLTLLLLYLNNYAAWAQLEAPPPEEPQCDVELEVQETFQFQLQDQGGASVQFLDVERQFLVEESFVLSYSELVSCSQSSSVQVLDRAEILQELEPNPETPQILFAFTATAFGTSSCDNDSLFASPLNEEEEAFFSAACCTCEKPTKADFLDLLEQVVRQSTGLLLKPLDDPSFCPKNFFDSTVLVSVPYEEYIEIAGSELEQEFANAFIDSYNSINAEGDACDPLSRMALEGFVELPDRGQIPRRHLQNDEIPLDFFLPQSSHVDLLLHISGSCRGCSSDQNLFDDIERPPIVPSGCTRCEESLKDVGSPEVALVVDQMNVFLETSAAVFVSDMLEVDAVPCSQEQFFFSEEVVVDVTNLDVELSRDEWEIAFLDTYQDLSKRYCNDPFFTEVQGVEQVDAIRDGRSSLLLFQVDATCRGGDCTVFGDIRNEQFVPQQEDFRRNRFENGLDVCYCPSIPLGFNGLRHEVFVESLLDTVSREKPRDDPKCSQNFFQSNVIFSVPADDVDFSDPSQIEDEIALAFVESYNQVSIDGEFCDPLGRQVVQANAAIVDQEEPQRRMLMDDLTISSAPSYAPTSSPTSAFSASYYNILLFISGTCFGCPPEQNLFDQIILGRRELQEAPTNCLICNSTNATSISSPLQTQVVEVMNEFLENTTQIVDLVEVDPVKCSSEVEMFSEEVALNLSDVSLSLSPDELSIAFLDSYNQLTRRYCDAPFFTTVTGVDLLSGEADDDLLLFQVHGTCRGSGCSLFASNRTVLPTTDGNEDDVCYCPTDPIDFRLPTKDEFMVALVETDATRDDGNACNTTEVTFDSTVMVSLSIQDIDSDFDAIQDAIATGFMDSFNQNDTGSLCDPLGRSVQGVDVNFSTDDGRTGTRTFKLLLHVSTSCVGCDVDSTTLFSMPTASDLLDSCGMCEDSSADSFHRAVSESSAPTKEAEVVAKLREFLEMFSVDINYIQEVELLECPTNQVSTVETIEIPLSWDPTTLEQREIENTILDTYDSLSSARCDLSFSALHRANVLDLNPLSIQLEGTYRGVVPSLFASDDLASASTTTSCYCPIRPVDRNGPTEEEFKMSVEENLLIAMQLHSRSPSSDPSAYPSSHPSISPSQFPSIKPSDRPSTRPSVTPSSQPTPSPTPAKTYPPQGWVPPGQANKPWKGPPGHAHGRPNNPNVGGGGGGRPGRPFNWSD